MAHTTENLMAQLEEACSLDRYLARLEASGKQAPASLADYLNTLLAGQPQRHLWLPGISGYAPPLAQ